MGIYNLSKGVNRFCLSKPGESGRIDVLRVREMERHQRVVLKAFFPISVQFASSCQLWPWLAPLEGAAFLPKEIEVGAGMCSQALGLELGPDHWALFTSKRIAPSAHDLS